jgi:hypothetical protein
MKHYLSIFCILILSFALVQNFDLLRKKLKLHKFTNTMTTESGTEIEHIPTGQWYLIRNSQTNKCITKGGDTYLRQLPCDFKNQNQWWKIANNSKKGKGWIFISSHNGQMIDDRWGSRSSGNSYWVYNPNGTTSQNFFASKELNGFTLYNEQGRKCLTSTDYKDNTNITQHSCGKKKNQQWTFDLVSEMVSRKPSPSAAAQLALRTSKNNQASIPIPAATSELILDHSLMIQVKNSNYCLIAPGVGLDVNFSKCSEIDNRLKFVVTKNGESYNIRNLDGYALDLKLSKKNNGNKIWIYAVNGTDAQNWHIIPVGNGYYKIVSKSSGKCLDNPNNIYVHQWDCHGLDNQLFKFVIGKYDKKVTFNTSKRVLKNVAAQAKIQAKTAQKGIASPSRNSARPAQKGVPTPAKIQAKTAQKGIASPSRNSARPAQKGVPSTTNIQAKTAQKGITSPSRNSARPAQKGVPSTTNIQAKTAQKGIASPSRNSARPAQKGVPTPTKIQAKTAQKGIASPSRNSARPAQKGVPTPTKIQAKTAQKGIASPSRNSARPAQKGVPTPAKIQAKTAQKGIASPSRNSARPAQKGVPTPTKIQAKTAQKGIASPSRNSARPAQKGVPTPTKIQAKTAQKGNPAPSSRVSTKKPNFSTNPRLVTTASRIPAAVSRKDLPKVPKAVKKFISGKNQKSKKSKSSKGRKRRKNGNKETRVKNLLPATSVKKIKIGKNSLSPTTPVKARSGKPSFRNSSPLSITKALSTKAKKATETQPANFPFTNVFGTFKLRSTGHCLFNAGAFIASKICNEGENAQLFRVEKYGKFYRLFNKNGNVLDLHGSNLKDGALFWMHPINGTPAQSWSFELKDGTYFSLRSQASNKCMNGSKNNSVFQSSCNTDFDQQFNFKPAGAPKRQIKKAKVPVNQWINIKMKGSKKCLSAKSKQGFEFMLEDCNSSDRNQKLKFIKNGKVYSIANIDGFVFDLKKTNKANGTKFWNWILNKSKAQVFKFLDAGKGYFKIQTIYKKCVENVINTNVIQQNKCLDVPNQKFKAIPIKINKSGVRPPSARKNASSSPQSIPTKGTPIWKKQEEKLELEKGHYQIRDINGKCLKEEKTGQGLVFTDCNDTFDGFYFKFEKQKNGRYKVISALNHSVERISGFLVSTVLAEQKNGQNWVIKVKEGNFKIKTKKKNCIYSENGKAVLKPCDKTKFNQNLSFIGFDKIYLQR